jgi:hypothetical protein
LTGLYEFVANFCPTYFGRKKKREIDSLLMVLKEGVGESLARKLKISLKNYIISAFWLLAQRKYTGQ